MLCRGQRPCGVTRDKTQVSKCCACKGAFSDLLSPVPLCTEGNLPLHIWVGKSSAPNGFYCKINQDNLASSYYTA